MEKERQRHPSFGMISISRVQSNGTVIFGSRILNNNYIQLEISTAEKERDAYSEFYFPKETLVTVKISPSQFANMLVHSNTSGVPCTIEYTSEQGRIEQQKEPSSVRKEMMEDTKKVMGSLKEKTKALSEIVKNDLKGQIKKAKKDEIRDLVIQIENAVNSNLDFLLKKQIQRMEEVGAEIVTEAEARIEQIIQNKGLSSLQKQKLIRR
jgi:hypothetical protein